MLLRKGVCPYEYIDSWEKFNKTSPPDKEAYYSKVNEEGISNTDYMHAQKLWEVFKIKDNGDYHDLYVQSDILLLAVMFETSEIKVLRFMSLILLIFCQPQD